MIHCNILAGLVLRILFQMYFAHLCTVLYVVFYSVVDVVTLPKTSSLETPENRPIQKESSPTIFRGSTWYHALQKSPPQGDLGEITKNLSHREKEKHEI